MPCPECKVIKSANTDWLRKINEDKEKEPYWIRLARQGGLL
jgi:hypothetical protein